MFSTVSRPISAASVNLPLTSVPPLLRLQPFPSDFRNHSSAESTQPSSAKGTASKNSNKSPSDDHSYRTFIHPPCTLATINPRAHSASALRISSTGTRFLPLETLHYYHSQQMVIRAVLCHVDLLALAIWKGFMKTGSQAGGWSGKSLCRGPQTSCSAGYTNSISR